MTLLQKIEEYQDEARAEGISIGREQGIGIGREQGKMEEKLELAKAFLDLADDKTIAAKTGLPIETINQLRKETIQKS